MINCLQLQIYYSTLTFGYIRILLSTRLNNNVSVNVRNWQIRDVNCQLNFPFTWEYSTSPCFIDLRAIRVQCYNSSVFHTVQRSAGKETKRELERDSSQDWSTFGMTVSSEISIIIFLPKLENATKIS